MTDREPTDDARPSEDRLREALARILHEKFMMPGHTYPGSPWKDACDESAEQLIDYLSRADIILAASRSAPEPLTDEQWDRVRMESDPAAALARPSEDRHRAEAIDDVPTGYCECGLPAGHLSARPSEDRLRLIRDRDAEWARAEFDGIHDHPNTQCTADNDRHVLVAALAASRPAPDTRTEALFEDIDALVEEFPFDYRVVEISHKVDAIRRSALQGSDPEGSSDDR